MIGYERFMRAKPHGIQWFGFIWSELCWYSRKAFRWLCVNSNEIMAFIGYAASILMMPIFAAFACGF